jgi:hypothetical protein
MKKLAIPALAASIFLLAGCNKSSPVAGATGAPVQAVDWGVVEVAASTPQHLKLDGQDCTLTATPLADGRAAVVIETEGSTVSALESRKLNTILPTGLECIASVGSRPVRLTLKFKPL